MARRRNEDGLPEDDGGVAAGGGGRIDEFGNQVPDFSGDPNYPRPFIDYQPEEYAGSTENAGSFGPGARTPTTSAPRAEPQPQAFNLPRGVSVNESMAAPEASSNFSAPDYGNSMDTPAMPMQPSPVASMAPNPGYSMPESGTNTMPSSGPARRSAQSPSIFAQSSNPMLSGRAGGLMGGGRGAMGQGEASGPLKPTEMFQKLLQLFQQG